MKPAQQKNYQEQNSEFIIFHAAMSKYRTLKIIILTDSKITPAFTYDIIIPKIIKQTTKMLQENSLKKINEKLTELTKLEKTQLDHDLQTKLEFLQNPAFYAELDDLINTVPKKFSYINPPMQVNMAILANGEKINSFNEISDKIQEIYLINNATPNGKIQKMIEQIEKTKEIPAAFNGLYRNLLDVYAPKNYNKNSPEIDPEFNNPYMIKAIKAGLLNKPKISAKLTSVSSSKILLENSEEHNFLQEKALKNDIIILPKIHGKFNFCKASKNKETIYMRMCKDMPKLDEKMAEEIKQNYKSLSYNDYIKKIRKQRKNDISRTTSKNEINSKILPKFIEFYKENDYIKSIIAKYRLNIENIEKSITEFYTLFTNSDNYTDKPKYANLLDFCENLKTKYNEITIPAELIKNYFIKLKFLPNVIFKRILLALDIKDKITLDKFCKIKHYLIDFTAMTTDFIKFGLSFINPIGKIKQINIDELYRILKLSIIKEETTIKSNMLLKLIIKSYILYGIIDNKGIFNPEIFEDIYRKGKMSILNFIKSILI